MPRSQFIFVPILLAMCALQFGGCFSAMDFEAGLACDDENPCATGYFCHSDVCVFNNGSGPYDLELDTDDNSDSNPTSFPEENPDDSGMPALEVLEYRILYDSNIDQLCSPGETVILDVAVQNTGNAYSNQLTAELASSDPDVAISDSYSIYSAMAPGDSKWTNEGDYSSQAFSFQLDSGATPHAMGFTLSLEDSAGNVWVDNFTIPLVLSGGDISIDNHEILMDAGMDGLVHPGDFVLIDIELLNAGSSTINAPFATLSTHSSYVSFTDDTSSYNALSPGESAWSDDSLANGRGFIFTVSEDAPSNQDISFILDVMDSLDNRWTDSFSLTVH